MSEPDSLSSLRAENARLVAPHDLEVVSRSHSGRMDLPADAGIQDVFRHLANDQARTEAIATEIKIAYEHGRKVLVLTERTDHLDAIQTALDGQVPAPFVLHGRMSRKLRAALLRMWDKRQRGYRAMGYRIAADAGES